MVGFEAPDTQVYSTVFALANTGATRARRNIHAFGLSCPPMKLTNPIVRLHRRFDRHVVLRLVETAPERPAARTESIPMESWGLLRPPRLFRCSGRTLALLLRRDLGGSLPPRPVRLGRDECIPNCLVEVVVLTWHRHPLRFTIPSHHHVGVDKRDLDGPHPERPPPLLVSLHSHQSVD